MDDFENELEGLSTDDGSSSDISSELIRGHINTIILRTLIDGEKYGTEIIEEIEKKSNGLYAIKPPTLYSALKRLESQGLLTSYWGGVTVGGRRRYYSLTEEGLATATKNIDEWEYSRSVIDSLIGGEKKASEPDAVLSEREEPTETFEEFENPAVEAAEEPEEYTESEPVYEEEEHLVTETPAAGTYAPAHRRLDEEPSELFSKRTSYPRADSFTDEDYHRIRRQSQFEGEYRYIIDSIFDTANANPSKSNKNFSDEIGADYSAPILRKKILKEPNDFNDEREDYRDASYSAFERYSAITGQPAVKSEAEKEPEFYADVSKDADSDAVFSVKKLTRDAEEIREKPIPQTVEDTEEAEPQEIYLDENDDSPAIDFSDIRKMARDEKVKLYFSNGDPIKKKIPEVSFNKGATLFKSAVLILILSFMEAIPVLILRDTLEVSLTYPLVMVLIPIILTAVFGLLTTLHYGAKTRKDVPMQYFTGAVIAFIIAVLAIASFAILKEFELNSLAKMFKYVFIPCLYAFDIVLFALIYYTLVKHSKK